jgi:sugar O-acyltransferase (sialic acid O-acetyltransferase NeuD family)
MNIEGMNFILWGSAGHAKVLSEMIQTSSGRVLAVFDNHPLAKPSLNGVPLYLGLAGFRAWKKRRRSAARVQAAVAIGGDRGKDRLDIAQFLEKEGFSLPCLIHPTAIVAPSARIGMASQVLAGAVVATEAHLGRACVINHRASVDHECVLGSGVHVAPGAVLCGCVQVGDHSFIGAGAVILPRVKIGRYCVVGAGAVLTKSLPDQSVAWGVPAKIQKKSRNSGRARLSFPH